MKFIAEIDMGTYCRIRNDPRTVSQTLYPHFELDWKREVLRDHGVVVPFGTTEIELRIKPSVYCPIENE